MTPTPADNGRTITADSAMSVPAGFTCVSQDEFYARLKDDPRDIMPTVENPFHTEWKTPQREVWGWSLPGWKNPRAPNLYAIKSLAATRSAP